MSSRTHGTAAAALLNILAEFGFDTCPAIYIPPDAKADHIASKIQKMTDFAEFLDMPIDGMVLRFNSFSYSATLGRIGHHYNDGIAYKFADDTYETVFRSVEWQTGRFGEIAPVAVFDTVEIDGCGVSRASLHNLSFIKGLELHPGCRILVSKRNMIIHMWRTTWTAGAARTWRQKPAPAAGIRHTSTPGKATGGAPSRRSTATIPNVAAASIISSSTLQKRKP